MAGLTIRPMTPDDVPEAERVSDEGFFELDTRRRRISGPAPERRSDPHRAVWIERTLHLVGTDPGGCWVAEDETGMVGMATSYRRETLWCLATYAVLPGRQGQGIGKPLLAAALDHGRACTRGMLSSSSDAKAVRVYHQAGFDLHPQMYLTGTLDRSTLPVVEKVREGSAVRHRPDGLPRPRRPRRRARPRPRADAADAGGCSSPTRRTGSGYAYLNERGQLALLAASNRRTATRLLWAALADGPERGDASPTSPGANQWVLDVGFAARLELHQEGYLGLRGMKPPSPYVHNGALL